MADPVNFQVLGAKVKQMAADGIDPAAINQWLGQVGTSLDMLNASGFGLASAKAKSPDSVPSVGRSAAIGTTQGLSFGLGDEAASAIAATIGRPGGQPLPGKTWKDRYQAGLDIARPQQKEAQEAHPYAYGAGELVGGALPMVIAPEAFGTKLIAEAPTAMQMAGRSAAVGVPIGGLNAFGRAEGSPGQQALETGAGAVTGAAVGAVAPYLVNKSSDAVRWVWNKTLGWRPATTVAEAETVAPSFGEAAPPTTTPLTPPSPGSAAPMPPPRPSLPGDVVERERPRTTIDVKQTDRSQSINKIAEALRRDGYSAEEIAPILNKLGPEGTLADIGPNTRQLLTSSMGAPGAGKQIGSTALENRQAGQQDRLEGAFNKALGGGAGFHETDNALMNRLETESIPLYEKAYAEAKPVDISGVLDQIDTSLAKVPQKSPIRAATEKVKSMLLEEIKGTDGKVSNRPYADLETLHNAKLAIDDMLSKYTGDESLGNVSRRQVTQIKNQLLQAMDESNPLYGEARSKFSGIMTSKDALKAGREFIKEDAESTAATLAELDPADQQFFREGAKRALVDIVDKTPPDVSVVQQLRKTGLVKRIRTMIPDDAEFKDFIQTLENERRFANTRAQASGGSQSFEKAMGAADLASGASKIAQAASGGGMMGLARTAMQILSPLGKGGEETRAMIAKRLSEGPSPARDELLKALAYAQRLQAVVNRGGAVAGQIGAATGGPGAASLGRQP